MILTFCGESRELQSYWRRAFPNNDLCGDALLHYHCNTSESTVWKSPFNWLKKWAQKISKIDTDNRTILPCTEASNTTITTSLISIVRKLFKNTSVFTQCLQSRHIINSTAISKFQIFFRCVTKNKFQHTILYNYKYL